MPRYLTVGAIAEQLQISPSQAHRIAMKIKHFRDGRLLRVCRASFEVYLRQKEQQGWQSDSTNAATPGGAGSQFDPAARDPRDEVPRVTSGLLADAVLVYAASAGSEVTNLAMRLCRRKGTVVLIGAVGMDLDRSLMYEKELDLLISTSYGPGRYDPSYEEKGIDYPPAYVRWTENRNMAAFLELVRDGRVGIRPLIDRVYPIERASDAYDAIMVESGEERPLGVVLTYGSATVPSASAARARGGSPDVAPIPVGQEAAGRSGPNSGHPFISFLA